MGRVINIGKEVIVLFMKSTNTSKISIVFWVALAICTAFVIYGAILPKQLEQVTQTATSFIAVHFSWYYLFTCPTHTYSKCLFIIL